MVCKIYVSTCGRVIQGYGLSGYGICIKFDPFMNNMAITSTVLGISNTVSNSNRKMSVFLFYQGICEE